MKSTLLVFHVACFLFVSVSKSFSQTANVQDSLALVDLYDSTNGTQWANQTNWLTTSPLSKWFGVSVNSSGHVERLILDFSNLNGNIPSSLGNLSQVKELSFFDNNLSGIIPSSFSNLSQLQTLSLMFNNISGNIPDFLGNLTTLQALNLDYNQLTGNIPSELGNLTQIQYLTLSNNQLSGDIPTSLGRLTSLRSLLLYSNQLTGSIPDSLGNLLNLLSDGSIGLDVKNNQLSGIVPASLKNLPTEISLHDNKFTFAGIEELVASALKKVFYSPQANIPIYNQNNTLFVSAGGTPSNDTFRLYKDGMLSATLIGDSTFPITATGKYNIVVTNSVATQLTLYSDTLDISSLPITLNSFTASKNKTFVVLNWQTASEQNNSYFAIERSNNSNNNFKEIGIVNSKGNSSHLQQYSFEDFSPFSGGNYYHLKQVDKDGKTTYSKIVFVDFSEIISIKLYPNPVKDMLTLRGLHANNTTTISIISLQGSVLAKTTTTNSTYTWNIKQLPVGTYYVRIEADKNVVSLKFAKE